MHPKRQVRDVRSSHFRRSGDSPLAGRLNVLIRSMDLQSVRLKGKHVALPLAQCKSLLLILKRNPKTFGEKMGRRIGFFAGSLNEKQATVVAQIASKNPEIFLRGLGVNTPYFVRGLGVNVEWFARGLGKDAGAFAEALRENAPGFANGIARNADLFARGLRNNSEAFARGLGENAGSFAAFLEHSWFASPETIFRLTGKKVKRR